MSASPTEHLLSSDISASTTVIQKHVGHESGVHGSIYEKTEAENLVRLSL
jgi:hypothetical protein